MSTSCILDILLCNVLQGWVTNSVSFQAFSVFRSDFRQLFSEDSWSDTDYLDLSVARFAEAGTKALLSLWVFFSLALWLCFKISNTQTYGQLHIYLIPTSFSVNLTSQRGLYIGCYESHVSVALLPDANDWRHRNFHDYHKKPIPNGEGLQNCVCM